MSDDDKKDDLDYEAHYKNLLPDPKRIVRGKAAREKRRKARVAKYSSTLRVLHEVKKERVGQLKDENRPLEHDDQHTAGELAEAAASYATNDDYFARQMWPWDDVYDKRYGHARRRRLVLAAALLVAEIERIDRVANTEDE